MPGGSAAGSTLGFRLITAAGVPPAHAGFTLATVGLGSAVVLNLMLWLALLVSIPLRGFNPCYVTAAVVGLVLLGTFGGLSCCSCGAGPCRAGDPGDRPQAAVRPGGRRRPGSSARSPPASRAGRQPPAGRRGARLGRAQLGARRRRAVGVPAGVRRHGQPVDLLVGFGLANVLAAIPITPGGLGVVEAMLTSTLVGFGSRPRTAALGVLTYRLAAFWLPIPLGGLSYARSPRQARARLKLGSMATETRAA